MNSKKEVQHVYLVGAKSLGAYGGYETFVYKLTEYHQNKETYKECVSNLRKNIFLPLKMEKSIKKKIMWCCYFISPRLMAIRKAIGFKKAAKTVCGGDKK